jgi:manganese/zinc/iron transport system permease protein
MKGINGLVWELDGWIIVAGVLAAVSASLLGNFLVLRKMSLLGDAISHAILPGLAMAFLITSSRNSWVMFLGASIVGLMTAVFTQWIRGIGKVDEGASMGVVFTSLFAIGLVMIVQAADDVDLDPGCVLYGAIEFTPLDTWLILGWHIPRVVVIQGSVLLLNVMFVGLLFKELKISSFDPALSTTSGIPAWLMHYALMTLVAITAVASFESVGNILVVAMMIVPPATAFMLTVRLGRMIVWSSVIAAAAAVIGHLAALWVPNMFGYRSTSTAGMIAVVTGLFFVLAAFFAPQQGVFVRSMRQRLLALRILREDILGLLYRLAEKGDDEISMSRKRLQDNLLVSSWEMRIVLWQLQRWEWIEQSQSGFRLTAEGTRNAQQLVRSHRLWETYLIVEAGVDQNRIHQHAEQLEHFTSSALGQRLSDATDTPTVDPHGSPIPSPAITPPTKRQ